MTIANYALLSITRKLGAHYIIKEGDSTHLTDDVLAICLPFGNSNTDCIKLKYYDSKYYFSIIKIFTDQEGIGIICPFDSISEIIEENLRNVREILNFLDRKMNYKSQLLSIISSVNMNKHVILEINNIQSAIISLLINKKIFILDHSFQIFSLIYSLMDMLPPKFHKFLDFTINSTSYAENVNIMALQYSKELFFQLDSLNQEKNTLIDIQNSRCFGIYSSPLITDVLRYMKNNSEQKAKELMEILEYLVFENKNIATKVSDIPKKYKVSKVDLKLIDHIKLNLLDLPQKRNLFEELIK